MSNTFVEEQRRRFLKEGYTKAQAEMLVLGFLLLQEGYSFIIEPHHLENGTIIHDIRKGDENGELIEGDFICGKYAYGNDRGLLEAGFGFGIKENTNDNVLGYLTAEDCVKLVKGEYWK